MTDNAVIGNKIENKAKAKNSISVGKSNLMKGLYFNLIYFIKSAETPYFIFTFE